MTPLQREALQMCLEYIEEDAHERRHVRWKIQEALAAPVQSGLDADCIASVVSQRYTTLPAAAQQEPVAHLWQHSQTGRTRIVMPGGIITADATWFVVGPLVLGNTTPPAAQRQWVGLTDGEIDLFINGRGDEDDDDYVEPTGDGYGLTDSDLMKLVRRSEAKLKEKNT